MLVICLTKLSLCLKKGKQLGNYFLIASTRKRIEFAHGIKDDKQKLKWVTERDFKFSTLLGKGGFGVVYKARRRSTGKDYALKIQPMEIMVRSTKNVGKKEEDETLIHMERTVLASCRGHPFIVKLEYAFHTRMYAVLGLEYVPGGTLSSLISNSPDRRLTFQLSKLYTIEMIIALEFMHCKGIIYRDLKVTALANINRFSSLEIHYSNILQCSLPMY